MLIAPTAVVPEGYTLRFVVQDRAGNLRLTHPGNTPAQPPLDPAHLTKEMALMQRSRASSRDTELEGKLGEVQTQTLVVFGTADKVLPPAMGRTYRERMPNCHDVPVYDAGQAVAAERPQALTNASIGFLDPGERSIVSRRGGRVNQ